nr:unnamed protein product [Callosobruchus chinensis]
MLVLQHHFFC